MVGLHTRSPDLKHVYLFFCYLLMNILRLNLFSFFLLILFSCNQQAPSGVAVTAQTLRNFPEARPDLYWKKKLTPEAYGIMVDRGTETPFRNPYWDNHQKGIYVSAATGKPLFSSDTKFDSGTGWPSFSKPINESCIKIITDNSFGMERKEVVESSTGLHLGHVFDDGPRPTGKRYCMDSYAFKFIPAK